jgi:ketosteroid isomerase-like protein
MPNAIAAADQLAIHNVIARYAWALDTGDVEGFVACFSSDGELVWDAFEQPQSWRGEHALRHFATFFRALPSSAGRQHHVSNIVLTPDAEGIAARSYVAVALRQGDGPHALHVMGWYEDLFRQVNGNWQLARRVIRDWSGPILADFAGQTGERVPRAMPPPLAGLAYPDN